MTGQVRIESAPLPQTHQNGESWTVETAGLDDKLDPTTTTTTTTTTPERTTSMAVLSLVTESKEGSQSSLDTETSDDLLGPAHSSMVLDGDDSLLSPTKLGRTGVSFSTVRIHSHRLTLGDNPGVSKGIPLTLAWEVENSETLDLEAFEKLHMGADGGSCRRSSMNKGSGKRTARRLPSNVREQIARENHSRDSLLERKVEVLLIKESRKESVNDREALMTSIRGREAARKAHKKKSTKKKEVFFGWFRRGS